MAKKAKFEYDSDYILIFNPGRCKPGTAKDRGFNVTVGRLGENTHLKYNNK